MLSHQKPFKVQFRVNVNSWDGGDDEDQMTQWKLLFKYRKYTPIQHIKTQGINLMLSYGPSETEWSSYTIGFDSIPGGPGLNN